MGGGGNPNQTSKKAGERRAGGRRAGRRQGRGGGGRAKGLLAEGVWAGGCLTSYLLDPLPLGISCNPVISFIEERKEEMARKLTIHSSMHSPSNLAFRIFLSTCLRWFECVYCVYFLSYYSPSEVSHSLPK